MLVIVIAVCAVFDLRVPDSLVLSISGTAKLLPTSRSLHNILIIPCYIPTFRDLK